MTELKPCPFCGGTNVAVKQSDCALSGHKYWYVTHVAPHNKCCLTDSFNWWHSAERFTTKEKAIEAWNNRQAVSFEVWQNTAWERDLAISQLKEHGITFGCIAPDVVKVVRCRNCKHGQHMKGSETYMCHSPRYTEYEFHLENHYCGYGERKHESN